MNNPIIADNRPRRVSLEKGLAYFFCSCGRSASQPFCDGSHRDTGITPRKLVAEKDGDVFACMCKHSGNLPLCDGSHKQFPAEQVGREGPGRG